MTLHSQIYIILQHVRRRRKPSCGCIAATGKAKNDDHESDIVGSRLGTTIKDLGRGRSWSAWITIQTRRILRECH